MDHLDQLRAGVTLLSFLVFAGLMVWAWSHRNRDRFAEAAQLPFAPEAEDIPS
jgi:cytochrome c oxidase cbb3-type subunit 4